MTRHFWKKPITLLLVSAAIALGTASIPSAEAQQFTTLYSFCTIGCDDGAGPYDGLIQGIDGNFYGTTYSGGNGAGGGEYGAGTIFQITPNGTLKTLYSFCSQPQCADGAWPVAGLFQSGGGTFYGTTPNGGPNNSGVFFSITPNGDYTMLYGFCSAAYCADGGYPMGRLTYLPIANDFRGTTSRGGTGNGPYNGTLFRMDLNGQIWPGMYMFCGLQNCGDGEMPEGTLVLDTYHPSSMPVFYGTAYRTEVTENNNAGTVFMYGAGLNTLHTFCSEGGTNCTDGMHPGVNLLLASDGNLYGTTIDGGTSSIAGGGGTIFKITIGGNPTYQFSTLYTFCTEGTLYCPDGGGPYGGLIQGTDGNFYGTTEWGGELGSGTIFELTPSGTFTTLYNFCSQAYCNDGAGPYSKLVQGTDGNLYGTTYYEGANCNQGFPCGTVFRYTLQPLLDLSRTTINFGPQDLKVASAPQFITLNNDGKAALAITNIVSTGSFTQVNNCGTSVAVGASCQITVTFTPRTQGRHTGTLTITDNNLGVAGSQQIIPLTGTGTTSAATISTGSLAFGKQAIKTASAAKQVTLTSTGTGPLTFEGVAFTGTKPHNFSQTNNCPTTLSVNSSCTINVVFTPATVGAKTATLEIKDNAEGTPQTVSLTGTGAR